MRVRQAEEKFFRNLHPETVSVFANTGATSQCNKPTPAPMKRDVLDDYADLIDVAAVSKLMYPGALQHGQGHV